MQIQSIFFLPLIAKVYANNFKSVLLDVDTGHQISSPMLQGGVDINPPPLSLSLAFPLSLSLFMIFMFVFI